MRWPKRIRRLDSNDLNAIRPSQGEVQAAASRDPFGSREEKSFAEKKQDRELTKLDLLLESLRNNIRARKHFSWAIFALVTCYLISVVAIVVCTGLKLLNLDKDVLIALAVSGSANVIGPFKYVAQYLFHVPESHFNALQSAVSEGADAQSGSSDNAQTGTESDSAAANSAGDVGDEEEDK